MEYVTNGCQLEYEFKEYNLHSDDDTPAFYQALYSALDIVAMNAPDVVNPIIKREQIAGYLVDIIGLCTLISYVPKDDFPFREFRFFESDEFICGFEFAY